MITGSTNDAARAVYNFNCIKLVREVVHCRIAGGVVCSIPETLVGAVVRGRDALQLAQTVVSDDLNRTLRLTGRSGRLRAGGGAEVEVVLHRGAEAVCVGEGSG